MRLTVLVGKISLWFAVDYRLDGKKSGTLKIITTCITRCDIFIHVSEYYGKIICQIPMSNSLMEPFLNFWKKCSYYKIMRFMYISGKKVLNRVFLRT